MVNIVTGQITAEEFLQTEETNQIIQLIDGEIVVNPPLDKHQAVIGQTYLYLSSLLPGGTLRFAPTGIYIDPINFYEPDIFWISPSNPTCKLREDGRFWEGAPDLVVEVFSPGTASKDKTTKFRVYEQFGIHEYWMADPLEEYVEVWRQEDDKFIPVGTFVSGETFISSLLAEQPVEVARLFGR